MLERVRRARARSKGRTRATQRASGATGSEPSPEGAGVGPAAGRGSGRPPPAVPARHDALDPMNGALLPAIELLSDPEWIARPKHDPAQEGGEHLVVSRSTISGSSLATCRERTSRSRAVRAVSGTHRPPGSPVAGRRNPIDPAPRCTQRSPAPAPQAADRAPAAGGLAADGTSGLVSAPGSRSRPGWHGIWSQRSVSTRTSGWR